MLAYVLLVASVYLTSFAPSVLAQARGWNDPGYSFQRPAYDGQELGYHTIDPADGCHRLAYGYTGNDKKGYDFAKNGF
ncbi:hypothetical protein JCM10212_000511, partial [Sporobolomyces blumeae]